MNILFVTQGESLRMFEMLRRELAGRTDLGRCGFIISNSRSYLDWLQDYPDFEDQGHLLLKEWELTGGPYPEPDMAGLDEYEKRLGGEPGLFGALVADRRLYMGPDCSYSQDYRRRFDDRTLYSILQKCVEATEKLFDELKPDVVASFICVTIFDYLTYLVAKSRKIPVLNLRPTRVGDRVSFSTALNDPSPEFVRAFEEIMAGRPSEFEVEALAHVKRVREKHGRYEGVIKPSDKPAIKINRSGSSPLGAINRVKENAKKYYRTVCAADNHVPNPLRNLLFSALINPARAKKVARQLAPYYADPHAEGTPRYAFYPLHTEPEVSLLVYGRPFVNQIEVIRALAMSLPADMLLYVKEHPWMVGKRSLNYYRKLLAIPRVKQVNPGLDARVLIQGADLITVITGSVALEAAIIGKPVITFGDCPYNTLPEHMVRRVGDLRKLSAEVKELMTEYHSDDQALKAYVAGVMETSASINLYSVLLKKQGVHFERSADYQGEIVKLADYFQKCLGDLSEVEYHSPKVAAW